MASFLMWLISLLIKITIFLKILQCLEKQKYDAIIMLLPQFIHPLPSFFLRFLYRKGGCVSTEALSHLHFLARSLAIHVLSCSFFFFFCLSTFMLTWLFFVILTCTSWTTKEVLLWLFHFMMSAPAFSPGFVEVTRGCLIENNLFRLWRSWREKEGF